MSILYRTGVEWKGRIGDYHVFHNYTTDSWNVVKHHEGDIQPPFCAYKLESILFLKGFSVMEIETFKKGLNK